MDLLRVPISFFENLVRNLRTQFAWVAVEPLPWKTWVQGFIWCQWGFETFLLLRQYGNYSKQEVPPALKKHLEKETFEKSQAYGRDKARFSFLSSLYHQIITSISIHYDVYAWAWATAANIQAYVRPGSTSQMLQSIFFVFTLALISSVLELPLSVYSTFVIEAKHGFNKTTVSTFVTDIIKTWILSFAIGAPFLSAFLYVFDWAGDSFVPFLMAFMVAFQLVMIVIYPVFIQPLFNKLTPLPEGELRTRIEKLASSLKYPLSKLYIIDGSKRSAHSNAYMYGLPWSKHIVIFDTLIEQSKSSEVEAVIAHELGHWYYNHPMKLLFISQFNIFFILTAFSVFQHSPPLLKSFGFPNQIAAQPPTLVAFWIFQLLLTPTEAFLSFLINGVSRRFEWQADYFAADLPHQLGDKLVPEQGVPSMGDRLGNALITLHVKNLSTVWVDWLFSAYHHSHPTLLERLKELELYKTKAVQKGRKDL